MTLNRQKARSYLCLGGSSDLEIKSNVERKPARSLKLNILGSGSRHELLSGPPYVSTPALESSPSAPVTFPHYVMYKTQLV